MDCNEIQSLLEADIDGELDLVRHLEIGRHLSQCAACADRAEALRARKFAVRERLPRYAASSALSERVRTALRQESAAASDASPSVGEAVRFPSPVTAQRRKPFAWSFGLIGAFAASWLIALAIGYRWGDRTISGDRLLNEAVAEHVRSMQVDHLLDVVSTDQHTVKPWFAGKLDFSAPVVDLPEFPLVGGRLDHLDGRTAAALVYRRRQHFVNLFVWPADHGPVAPATQTRDGFHVETWNDRDLNFLAISEIPAAELHDFVMAYRGGRPLETSN